MSKDDYFKLVYIILARLYKSLRTGERPDIEQLSAEALDIPVLYWNTIMKNISNKGYVSGVFIKETKTGMIVSIRNIEITQDGIEYLSENSMMKKIFNFLKETKEIIPGI